MPDSAENGCQRGQEQAEIQGFAVENVFQHKQAVRLGLKVRIAIVVIAVFDFPIAVIPNNTRPMDDTVQGAKALIHLLDDPPHRANIRHTRVHIPDVATQFLDPLDCADSRADGILGRVVADPRVPGFSAREVGTPDQHKIGSVLFGQVF